MFNKRTEFKLKLPKQTSISQTDQNEGIILPNERKYEIVPNVKKPEVLLYLKNLKQQAFQKPYSLAPNK